MILSLQYIACLRRQIWSDLMSKGLHRSLHSPSNNTCVYLSKRQLGFFEHLKMVLVFLKGWVPRGVSAANKKPNYILSWFIIHFGNEKLEFSSRLKFSCVVPFRHISFWEASLCYQKFIQLVTLSHAYWLTWRWKSWLSREKGRWVAKMVGACVLTDKPVLDLRWRLSKGRLLSK